MLFMIIRRRCWGCGRGGDGGGWEVVETLWGGSAVETFRNGMWSVVDRFYEWMTPSEEIHMERSFISHV